MFERFSRGYYVGRLYVEPSADDRATMCKQEHDHLVQRLYASGKGIERLDVPLVMKLGSSHLPVHGEEGVPAQTLAIPDEWLESSRIRNPPTLKEVLLAKGERASQLLGLGSGGT